MDSVKSLFDEFDEYHFNLKYVDLKPFLLWQGVASDSGCTHGQAWPLGCLGVAVYDNEITSLIDIYFLRVRFIPSDPFRYFIYVTYSTDK